MGNEKIMDEIRRNIHIENNILEDLEQFNLLNEKGVWDHTLENKIINVDEFSN